MKVIVNVDGILPVLDDMIIKGLEQEGYPTCLGNMIPPLLMRKIEVDEEKVLKVKGLTPTTEIVLEDVSQVVESNVDIVNNRVMTQEGIDYINEYKTNRAEMYVKQLVKCISCEYVDTCYKLTTTYLTLISIEEKAKETNSTC